jgi:cyclase
VAGSTPSSKHYSLQQLAPGIYAAIAKDGGWAVCNAGIVDLGDHTLVFDTFVNQDAAQFLRADAERITGRKIDYVINSHRHGDHVRGNQAFPHARIVATEKTREVMARLKKTAYSNIEELRRGNEKMLEELLSTPDDPDTVLQEGYIRGALEGLRTLEYTLPDVTFETSMRFKGTIRDAEVVTYGGGHTESDCLLYIADQRIVFLGDLLFIDYQPYLADGDPDQLFRILDKVEELDAKALVPGHGPVGTPEDLGPMRDYVAGLERTVEEVKATGGGPEEAIKRPVDPRYRSWMWRSFYKDNIEFLFKEKPKPDKE